MAEAARNPTAEEMAAWTRLVRVSGAVMAAVEAALKAAGQPPLAWYDALLELERAGDGGLRPGRLQAEMLLAQWNVSRLIDRLERAGLVQRLPDPEDGRAQLVRITAAGRAARAAIWPHYRAAVAAAFAGRLAPGEAAALHALLGRLVDR